MSIGDVFARAWDLWRRDVGWLILAGLVVGLIMAVIFGIGFGVFAAITAGAGATIGADLADDSTSSLTGLGAGMLGVGVIVYAVFMFLVQVVAMTFYGGMFEMVIGAYRQQRNVRFGDLFSGFRKFGAYARVRARAVRHLDRPQSPQHPPGHRRDHQPRRLDLDHDHLAVRAAADRRPGPGVRPGRLPEQPDGQGGRLVVDLRDGRSCSASRPSSRWS